LDLGCISRCDFPFVGAKGCKSISGALALCELHYYLSRAVKNCDLPLYKKPKNQSR
jgi:hypothetical protein